METEITPKDAEVGPNDDGVKGESVESDADLATTEQKTSDEMTNVANEDTAESSIEATEEKMDVDAPSHEDYVPQQSIDDTDQEKDVTNLTEDLVLHFDDDAMLSTQVTENPTKTDEQQLPETLEEDPLTETLQEESTDNAAEVEIDELMQLPKDLNTQVSASDINLEPEKVSSTVEKDDGIEQQVTDILEEATRKIEPNKWKAKGGSFSLGVPGLTFSAQNLKVANDGTKMVQIHQSQITASQLEALQSNPNIKVVFRHIPSGKSFTKPPKNLFSAQKKNGVKRKHDDQDADDSIYNFDDFDGDTSYDTQPKPKVPNMGGGPTKYARYNPNVGFKKKVGRPRLIPESDMADGGIYSKPVLPAQIQLTDALVKLNKPGAIYTVKVHVKQVTHDILINMELNPKYNIVLTAKHEVPPEHSLEELVKEWEEKETLGQPQHERQVVDAEETVTIEDEITAAQKIEITQEKERLKETQKIRKEKQQAEQQKTQKLLDLQKEKEEAELLSASLAETKSRSGRVRKPSRFSLDIARMTKRHSQNFDASPEKELMKSPKPPPPPVVKQQVAKTPPSSSTSNDQSKKRGRGRPRKFKKQTADTSITDISLNDDSDDVKKVSVKPSSPAICSGPVVMLSPADKREADKRLQESSPTKIDDKEKDKPEISEPTTENVEKDMKTDEIADGDTVVEIQDLTPHPEETATSQSSKDSDEPMTIDDSTPVENDQPAKDETENQDQPKSSEPVDVPSAATDIKGESPSDILARKLSKDSNIAEAKDTDKTATDDASLKDFVEEEGDVDNKYRLRKLLQQCSIEEIRSVAMPRALDVISVGDFFIHKAGQMSKKSVNFPSLYSQLEDLYTCVEKESIRYSTLLRRANKVGGDRRMEKVILMPVYNKQAAESLHINSSSIDAHIGGIYQKPTTHMIAANSFHMNCKMEPPLHRLKLPELNDRNQARKKRGGGVFPQPQRYVTKQTVADTLSTNRPYTTNRPRGSWKRGYQVRKPNYLGEQMRNNNSTTLQEHARMQLANRYQSHFVAKESSVLTSTVIGPTTTTTVQAGQKTHISPVKQVTTEGDSTTQINAALSSDLTAQATTEATSEEGATVVSAEDGKQLVSIGDGQYVELPEGYTLIQTDEGYIIGQPGATFVQGDDGNVYMTSTEDGTTEMTDQVLTTTANINETQPGDQILDQLTQG